MNTVNADLHCHSDLSDGTLSPEALAERAHAGGVELWALTDHDDIAGLARARDAALALRMDFLTGTEISVSFADETVHIVGLGFDIDNAALQAGLAGVRAGRLERARAIGEQLARCGIPGAFDGAMQYAGHLVTRAHFARFLIERGVCSDMNDVFRRYLTDGKPGYVPHRWAALGDAVRWITDAGGAAVIAHPARCRYTPIQEYALFNDFVGHGGRALEVMTGSHSDSERIRYADAALEHGLLASRGSDFHAPGESRTDLGALPDLPGRLTPVWEALQHRVQRG